MVEVFLPPVYDPGPFLAFTLARDTVNAIYSEIGVRIAWTTTRSLPAGCTKQPLHMQIVVALGSSEHFPNAEALVGDRSKIEPGIRELKNREIVLIDTEGRPRH